MKTIGLLGGMSWGSTIDYYRKINEGVGRSLGGLHSAKIVMYSVDFGPIEELMKAGLWDEITENLTNAASKIEAAGADFMLICTNTMHKLAPQIEASVKIPLLHIADATGETLMAENVKTVALLGTAFTMEQTFYSERLSEKFGLNVLIPEKEEREIIHNVIFEELCRGTINGKSKNNYLKIIEKLKERGAEAVILGCTEIGMLIDQEDTSVRLFDTTEIHARKAVEYALNT